MQSLCDEEEDIAKSVIILSKNFNMMIKRLTEAVQEADIQDVFQRVFQHLEGRH